MTRGDLTRRGFSRFPGTVLLGGAAALPLVAGSPPNAIGQTDITWGNDSAQAIADLSAPGYRGFGTFASTLESPELRGGLRSMANASLTGMIMMELDSSPNMPTAPAAAARIGKSHPDRLGYTFRTQENQP